MCVQQLLVLIVASASTYAAAESGFLAHPSTVFATEHAAPAVVRELITEIESALGAPLHNSTSPFLSEIETSLLTSYNALPKNTMGNLDQSAASFLLNRLFVQRHGWVIRGLQPEISIESANKTLISRMLGGQMPSRIQDIFQKKVNKEGWSLNVLAAFAGLLEHLMGEEIVGRLEQVYKVKDIAITEALDFTAALTVAELYMMFYIQGYEDVSQLAQSKIKKIEANFHLQFPPWPKARQMLQQILKDIAPDSQTFRFLDVVRALREAVNHFYQRVQKEQCQHTKGLLTDIEDRGSGRVKLLDFYSRAIYDQKYQFTETIEFLRQNGALDESDPFVPRVIISNYVSGQSNCVARSAEYAVCCPDDCEIRFKELEHKLGKPSAAPAEILDIQEQAKIRGHMTPLLVRRLYEISELHGGFIPVHGRLFRQWMHFVHPDACMYPYRTGTVYTKTMEEWEVATGMRTGALTQEVHGWLKNLTDMQSQRNATKNRTTGLIGNWTMEEELVVHDYEPPTSATRRGASAWTSVSIVVSLGILSGGIRHS